MTFFQRFRPEDFDVLGIFTFSFLFCYAGYELWTGEVPHPSAVVILLLVAIFGLAIDGRTVWHFIIKKDEK